MPRAGLFTMRRSATGSAGLSASLHVGERVLHLGPVVEAHAPDHDVGDVVLEQRLLEQARLRVRAVEHREVTVGAPFLAHAGEQLAHHELRLLAVVARLDHRDRLAARAGR